MNPLVTGLHHLTAIASDPQENVNFYASLLGLRLVKKTVNFDDPSAYHLYYGDETGSPGSIITFFYWPGLAARGRVGAGQSTAIVFSAPTGSLDFWQQRLQRHNVSVARRHRFGEEVLAFSDSDGISLEIVAVSDDARSGWSGAVGIPSEYALRGLHTAELTVRSGTATEALLTGAMDYREVRREGTRTRFEAGPGGSGRYTDVIADPAAVAGLGGAGTIHHIAWRVADDNAQRTVQKILTTAGQLVSPVRDRQYFRSIYYREPNGILFEVATDTPGFAIDESVGSLGTELKLPGQFELHRAEIEQALPPLKSSE